MHTVVKGPSALATRRCQRVSVAVSGDFCHETVRKCTKFLKHTCFTFELFAMNATLARGVAPP